MRIPQDRSQRAGNPKLSIDQRIHVGFKNLSSESAPLEHLAEIVGIPSDVRFVGGDIWDRQQCYQLAEDFLLMLSHVSSDCRPGLRAEIETYNGQNQNEG